MSSKDTYDLDASQPIVAQATDDGPDGLLQPGARIGGMEVMRLLGEGGMGQVWMARDLQLGRRVALKVIRADRLASGRAGQRFLFEAKTMAQFSHPNIVSVYTMGTNRGAPWLALELVEGGSLRDRLSVGVLSPLEGARVGVEIASALAHAHSHGVLHRDLKPENVLLGTDGRCRVVDFGLAQNFAPDKPGAVQATQPERGFATAEGHWCGTPPYMAPEQFGGAAAGPASDVWSLGVLMVECLTGSRPFDQPGDSPHQLMRTIVSLTEAPRLEGLPDALRGAVALCLSPDPSLRPSVQELRVELERFIRPVGSSTELPPFRGLIGFTESQASQFFGREDEVATLAERLRTQPVLPLVGPSGTGKSSLVFGGLIPRLRERGPVWVLHTRPGLQPIDSLISCVRRSRSRPDSSTASGPDLLPTTYRSQEASDELDTLRSAPEVLGITLRAEAAARGACVVLVVDQLEELLTVAEPTERMAYLRAVCLAADDPQDPVRVILTLRDDFLGRLALDKDIARVLSRVYVVHPPGPASLRVILSRPIEARGYRWEDPAMVDELVASTASLTACLPLLQVAGALLWEGRDGAAQVIPRSAMEAIGGVQGALAVHAERSLSGLTDRELQLTRRLILRLITDDHTRAVVPIEHALEELGQAGAPLVELLVEHRLVTRRRSREGTSVIELSHEALITHWGQLKDWLRESHGDIQIESNVALAAGLWDRQGRPVDGAWSGKQGDEARAALSAGKLELTEHGRSFLAAGAAWQERARRSRARLVVLGGALLAMLLLSLVWGVFTERSKVASERARVEQVAKESAQREASLYAMRAGKAVSEGRALDAMVLSLAAVELAEGVSPIAEQQEYQSALDRRRVAALPRYDLSGALTDVDRIAYARLSPDGRQVALAHREVERVEAWDVETGVSKVFDGCKAAIHGGAWSPDGERIAQACQHSIFLEVWSVKTGERQELRCGKRPGGDPRGTVRWFGDRLYAGGSEGVCIFGGDPLEQVGLLPFADTIVRLAVSERWVAAGPLLPMPGSDTLKVWDRETGVEVLSIPDRGGTVRGLALSGDHLAFVVDRPLSLEPSYESWELAETPTRSPSVESLGWKGGVAFSDDGTRFVSVDDDTVQVRDVSSATLLSSASHPMEGKSEFRFSPSGRILAEVSWQGLVRFVHTESGLELGRDQVQSGRMLPVGFIGEDRFMAFSQRHGLSIWDLSGLPSSVVVRPAGASLVGQNATGVWFTTAKGEVLFRAGEAAPLRTLGTTEGGEAPTRLWAGRSAAVTGSKDAVVHHWPLDAEAKSWARPTRGAPLAARYSPDDKWLAVSTADGWLHVFDRSGREELVERVARGGEALDAEGRVLGVTSPAAPYLGWSPDGAWLIAQSLKSGERLICPTESWACVQPPRMPSRNVLAFPDGANFFLGGRHHAVEGFRLKDGEEIWSLDEADGLISPISNLVVADGLAVAGTSDADLVLFSPEGEILKRLKHGSGSMREIGILSGGATVVATHERGESLDVWDVERSARIQTFDRSGWIYHTGDPTGRDPKLWADADNRAIVSLVLAQASAASSGRETALSSTNRRVCRGTGEVVPVVPFPTDSTVWVSPERCVDAVLP